jgi:hypothetical protein
MSKHPKTQDSIAALSEIPSLIRLNRYLDYLKHRHLYKPEERKRIEFSFEHDDFD